MLANAPEEYPTSLLVRTAPLPAHLVAEVVKLQLVDFLVFALSAVHRPSTIRETLFRSLEDFASMQQA